MSKSIRTLIIVSAFVLPCAFVATANDTREMAKEVKGPSSGIEQLDSGTTGLSTGDSMTALMSFGGDVSELSKAERLHTWAVESFGVSTNVGYPPQNSVPREIFEQFCANCH